MKELSSVRNGEVYKLGIIYTLVLIVIAAVGNYFTWHKQYPSTVINILMIVFMIIFWIALYVPLPVFIKRANWNLKDFGFVINKSTIFLSLLLALFIFVKIGTSLKVVSLQLSLVEAIARVGEEVFFRGFIFTLVLKLLHGKAKGNLWAVIISSLAFALVHTQTFLPSNPLTMFDIFTSALILGTMRYFTGSVLPGIIIHCSGNAGILGMIAGIMIYLLFIIISYMINRSKDKTCEALEEDAFRDIN